MAEKLAALSVDLDEIDNYAAIHGIAGKLGINHTAIYDKAIARLSALFAREGVPATFFAIGRDLVDRPENGAKLRALSDAGHEIGNHSLSHFYDLTRRDELTQHREVRGGADAIEAAVGVRPVGFRAPGYTITDRLFEVLVREGVRYDSSVFPCPPYYFAKAAALALIRLRGRRSRSILDDPRVLTAPADPYRIGTPYTKRGEGLCELPIGVTGDFSGRLPYIGTNVVLAGRLGARLLTNLVAGRDFVNLELHGIDLADAHEDGLEALAPHQPDLRRKVADKQAALTSAIQTLKKRGYRFVTLADAARHFTASADLIPATV